MSVVTPYKDSSKNKKEQVAEMFDNIAPKYDFLNHLLSMGIDKGWRKKGINFLRDSNPQHILDVATGTGDFAIAAYKQLQPQKVTGVDISKEMVAVGIQKVEKQNLTDHIELTIGDSEQLPFPDNTFDAATVAFGVRNFENLDKGLKDICRVLRPGSKFVVLEFAKPKGIIKPIFQFYFRYILPVIGRMISKDTRAYTYLPESVKVFPDRSDFTARLTQAGFKNAKWKVLTLGICGMYTAEK